MGVPATRKTVAKIMKLLGICGVSRRKTRPRTTDSNHDGPIAPNLLGRVFDCIGPNTVWVADITYLATRREWVYLSLIIDLFSRRIVGWTVGDSMHAEHTVSAVLKREMMLQSMAQKGDCWDNALAESTIGLIKAELPDRIFDSLEDLEKELFEYIEVFYNRQRRHSAAAAMAPAAFEAKMAA